MAEGKREEKIRGEERENREERRGREKEEERWLEACSSASKPTSEVGFLSPNYLGLGFKAHIQS
ncbi:hypothetical protein GBA52_002327 [Prunus armeniaca]|nr:hypothetical protein GBA52_002327 [Prunus armeniaca]